MLGIVTGGLVADGVGARRRLLDGDRAGFPAEFLEQKLVTARFYNTQLLPRAAALAPAVTAGPPTSSRPASDAPASVLHQPARSGRSRTARSRSAEFVGDGHVQADRLGARLDRHRRRIHRHPALGGERHGTSRAAAFDDRQRFGDRGPSATASSVALARASESASARRPPRWASRSATLKDMPLSVNWSPAAGGGVDVVAHGVGRHDDVELVGGDETALVLVVPEVERRRAQVVVASAELTQRGDDRAPTAGPRWPSLRPPSARTPARRGSASPGRGGREPRRTR